MYYVYTIINRLNDKLYIGTTSNINRFNQHITIADGGKKKYPKHYQKIHAAIKKYGHKNFDFTITKTFDNEDEAYYFEEDMISYLRSMNISIYNIAGGGKGTGSGINHPMFGKKLPKKWKENVKKSRKEMDEKTREKHR